MEVCFCVSIISESPWYNLQYRGEMLVGLSRRKSDGRNPAEHAVAAAVIALGLSELGPTGRGRENWGI